MKILILYAVAEELLPLDLPQHHITLAQTGVGKVNATITAFEAITQHNPDLVINIGTCGSVHHPVGSIHRCHTFIDRDMEKLKEFGLKSQLDFLNEITETPALNKWTFNSVCNTGDTFLTDADGTGDVFEMEAFAIASVCKHLSKTLVAIKYVTDVIGQNSVKHWQDKLADARVVLKREIEELLN